MVPTNQELRQQILHHFHDSVVGGHSGVYRTWVRLNNNFSWTGMKSDVQNYVAACDTCQRVKSDSRRPSGLLQPLPIPNQVWEDISMDFIEGLPQSNGYDGILVAVDRLTKYAHLSQWCILILPSPWLTYSSAPWLNYMGYPIQLLLTVIASSLAIFGRSYFGYKDPNCR